MVHFSGSDIVLFVIGFFLPPLSCASKDADWSFFSVLGHIPGVIYAWWIVYENREDPVTRQRLVRPGSRGSRRRPYVAVSSTPPTSTTSVLHYPQQGQVVQVIERNMSGTIVHGEQVVQTGQIVQTGQMVQTQQVVQSGGGNGGTIIQGGKQVQVTKGEPQVQHSQQSYTTTTETPSGPVHTTRTVRTTKYVVPVTTTTTTATILDKKDIKDLKDVNVVHVSTPPTSAH
ncbi:hypothetical protein BGZ68_006664 [Mortierella alpina]|nr:hypothetical protein BGZ68_006664 [Mortierella alpina]